MTLPGTVWDRVPFPVENAVGLTAGLCLQRLLPGRLPAGSRRFGWALLAAGTGLDAWAVWARGGEAIDRPERLVTSGPQALSRNPMYVGWSLIHVGVGLVTRSPWVLATWPVSFVMVHRQVVVEEQELSRRFGMEFSAYRARVPRYLPLRPRGT